MTTTVLDAKIEVVEKLEIASAADKIWALIENFDGLSQWFSAVASSVADQGNQLGSIRKVVLRAPGDPSLLEQLTAYDAAARSYSYAIIDVDPPLLPVKNYASTLIVHALADDRAQVEWRGAFYAAAPGGEAAARGAIEGVYRGGLADLKQRAEAGA